MQTDLLELQGGRGNSPKSAKKLPRTASNTVFPTAGLTDVFRPWEQARGILLGVSGGPDSVALMLLAAEWARGCAMPPPLYVATVDHGLRNESRGRRKRSQAGLPRWACRMQFLPGTEQSRNLGSRNAPARPATAFWHNMRAASALAMS